MSLPVVSAIAAMSENRIIGRAGGLPWHIPEDLKHFKTVTMGKPCIMGRKTFESFGGQPLPGRTNIIVSRSDYTAEGITVCADLQSALEEARIIAARDNADEIMICGGAQIYEQALPFTDRLYLTIVKKTVEGETFFPELDTNEWRETARRETDECRYLTMERKL